MWDISQHFGMYVNFTLSQNTTAADNKDIANTFSLFLASNAIIFILATGSVLSILWTIYIDLDSIGYKLR